LFRLLYDSSSQKHYFENAQDGATSWTLPTPPEPNEIPKIMINKPPPPPLPLENLNGVVENGGSEKSNENISPVIEPLAQVQQFQLMTPTNVEKLQPKEQKSNTIEKFLKVTIGDNHAWGINKDNFTYQLENIFDPDSWKKVDEIPTLNISVSSDGAVWRVLMNNVVNRYEGSKWDEIDGKMIQVAVGSVTNIYGVSTENILMEWAGEEWSNFTNTPPVKQVSVAADGTVLIITVGDKVMRQVDQDWELIGSDLLQIAVGKKDYVVGINSTNEVVEWNTNTWELVADTPPTTFIAADLKSRFWSINEDGIIFRSESLQQGKSMTFNIRSSDDELSANTEDDVFSEFDDFASSNSYTPLAPKKEKNRITFISDTATKRRSRSASVMGEDQFSSAGKIFDILLSIPDRGELENTVELDLFNGLGLGETHVLAAVKYVISPKRKSEARYLVVARDWCGAYCILIISSDAVETGTGLSRITKTNLKSKKRQSRIIAAYPLIMDFELELLEIKNLNRFNLILDGEETEMYSDAKQKDKLEKFLQYAYSQSTVKCENDIQLLSKF
jgi:hypothetical protein